MLIVIEYTCHEYWWNIDYYLKSDERVSWNMMWYCTTEQLITSLFLFYLTYIVLVSLCMNSVC